MGRRTEKTDDNQNPFDGTRERFHDQHPSNSRFGGSFWLKSHSTVIFLVLLLAFAGSNLLFWQVNTRILTQSIEAESGMYAGYLAENISRAIPEEEMIRQRAGEQTDLPEQLDQLKREVDDEFGSVCDVLILDDRGQVLASGSQVGASEERNAPDGEMEEPAGEETGKQAAGDTILGEALEGAGISDEAWQDALEQADQITSRKSYIFWSGATRILLTDQNCCVLQPLYDGNPRLLVVNRAEEDKAVQRRHFAQLMAVDLLLLVLMLILIVNNNARYRRQIIKVATTDELTGLANRKFFRREYGEFVREYQNSDISLFLLDVDYFKQINDSYGHAAGDEALRLLGSELKTMMKRLGGFAGRWGGDEFIAVVPLPADRLQAELEVLCRRVSEKKMTGGFTMTISAGVAGAGAGESPDESSAGAGASRVGAIGDRAAAAGRDVGGGAAGADTNRDLASLCEKAERALYDAKEAGRNQAGLYAADRAGAEERTDRVNKAWETVAGMKRLDNREGSFAGDADQEPGERKSFVTRIRGYMREKLIMSILLGVRWMVPFVAGGGILIALAFLFDAMSVDLSSLTAAERADLGSMTPIAKTLKDLGGVTFNFMLPVFASFMAYGLTGERAFVAGFVGGYMTIDCNAGFVGAMVAGFAAGVIAGEMQQFMRHLPGVIRNAAPVIIYPVFSVLLMKVIVQLVIDPLAHLMERLVGGILESVVTVSHLTGGSLAAMMMATDMGGIINKVGYNYGLAAIDSGNTDIMAAVMVGGMVPPIGIALTVLLFRKSFSEMERRRGPVTFFMGLSFITEGALPYVFTDIFRVIPCCMAGSALAGLLSELFGCTLPAPHGGIFVFPVMGHPLLYAVALTAGSLLTAVLLGLCKRGREVSGQADAQEDGERAEE